MSTGSGTGVDGHTTGGIGGGDGLRTLIMVGWGGGCAGGVMMTGGGGYWYILLMGDGLREDRRYELRLRLRGGGLGLRESGL